MVRPYPQTSWWVDKYESNPVPVLDEFMAHLQGWIYKQYLFNSMKMLQQNNVQIIMDVKFKKKSVSVKHILKYLITL